MTVSNNTPFNQVVADGTTGPFTFTFEVPADSDLDVYVDGTLKTLTTHYTVSGAGDENGGTITFTSGNAPTNGATITFRRTVELSRATNFVNNGTLNSDDFNDEYDTIYFILQELEERTDRAVIRSQTSSSTADLTLPEPTANNVIGWNADADALENKGAISDITTLAGIADDISTVAVNDSNVTTVANDLDGSDTIGTVASNISNVNSVAGISGNVTTVAGIQANVTTVAGDSADIQTVATNIGDVNNYADTYLGSAAAAPSTRTDGSSLETGDMYFNTTVDRMRIYDGASWVDAFAVNSDYLLRDGTLAMTGDLDMDGNNLFDAGQVIVGTGGTQKARMTQSGNDGYFDAPNGAAIHRANGTTEFMRGEDGIFRPAAITQTVTKAITTTPYTLLAADSGATLYLGSGSGTVTVPAASTLPDGWFVEIRQDNGAAKTINRSGSDQFYMDAFEGFGVTSYIMRGSTQIYGEVLRIVKRNSSSFYIQTIHKPVKHRLLQRVYQTFGVLSYSGGTWTSTGVASGFTRMSGASDVYAFAHGVAGMQDASPPGVLYGFGFNGAGGPSSHDGFAASNTGTGTQTNEQVRAFTAMKKNPPGLPSAGSTDTLTLYAGHQSGSSFYFGRPHTYGAGTQPTTSYSPNTHLMIEEWVDE